MARFVKLETVLGHEWVNPEKVVRIVPDGGENCSLYTTEPQLYAPCMTVLSTADEVAAKLSRDVSVVLVGQDVARMTVEWGETDDEGEAAEDD